MLLWFGLAMLVLLAILGAITFIQVRDAIIPLTKELSKEVLEARSAEVGRLVEGYSNEVRTISRRNLIRQGDFAKIKEDLTGRHVEINPDYEMIFYADSKGNYITSNNLEGNISDRDYFHAILLGSDDHFISSPLISRSTGEPIFVVAWAVFDQEGNKIGLIASTVLLETLSGVAGAIKIGKNGFGYIVDQSGLLFAHPDKQLRMSLNFLQSDILGYKGLAEIGREMASGNAGLLSYTRPDGDTLITAFNPIPHTPGWSLGVALYEEELMGTATSLMRNIIFTMIMVVLVVLLMVFFIADRISAPILQLKEGVKKVSSGNLDHTLSVKTGDEIEALANAFNNMKTDLKEYIKNLQETTAAKERIESELQVANKIQSSMLPRTFPPYPEIENLDLYAIMVPAREVGGDFYDFFPLDNRFFCFSIGDVSGKGIPAALFMVITRTILKNQVMRGEPLAEVFNQANNLLCSDNTEEMFVTVFMGILDTHTGDVEYVCAGHNPPVLSRSGEDFHFLEVKGNLVLGGMENYRYEAQRITLQPNDLLLVYTDGVNEAMNAKGELFGNERFFKTMNQGRGLKARHLIEKIQTDVESFVGVTPASDDLTMLAFTLTGHRA